MPLVERKTYRFNSRPHWEACARDGFLIDGDGLVVPEGRLEQPVSALAEDQQVLALAYDPSGRLFWLRSSGELMSFSEGHITAEGRLLPETPPGAEPPSAHLAVSDRYLWLAVGGRLLTFERLYWQLLGDQETGLVLALAADCTGAWCLIDPATDADPACQNGADKRDEKACWFHVGPSGSRDRPDVSFSEKGPVLGGGYDLCSDRLLTLTEDGVWRADLCAPDWTLVIDLCAHRCHFKPLRIAVDCFGIIHLLGIDPIDQTRVFLWSFDRDGARVSERQLRSETAFIASFDAIALAGAFGIVQLVEPSDAMVGAQGSEARHAVLLTPTLISPRDQGASWHRLRLEADLPEGASLRLRFASSDDDALARRAAEIAVRPDQSQTERLQAIEGLLPFQPEREATLTSADDPLAKRQFEVPLDGLLGTYLWIALDLHLPPASGSATLQALDIRYPARSSIEHLPAIYRADPERASALRRFLAVFETVFEDLEDQIGGLPARLDADGIADHTWIDFLLRWIGLPLPADIPLEQKHAFLLEAPDLLHRRGTVAALLDALRAVTGREVLITDRAAEPMPWVVADEAAELGKGTLLIRRCRRDFALGERARLGEGKLGSPRVPVAEDLIERIKTLQIEIDHIVIEDDAALQAIDAVLGYFLPVACRYRLTFRPFPGRGRQRLDRDARLAHDRGAEIGSGARIGQTRLSRQAAPRLRLDHHAPLDGRHRLL